MYASVRRYRLREGSMDELMRRVDEGFAEEIAGQPGFCSYEALDCGDGEVITISVFRESAEAEASRDLAQRWTDENLTDLTFDRLEPLHGAVMVSRAVEDMLEAAHATTSKEFASLRRYALRRGSIDDLMHIVDERFADRIADMPGFVGYHALDCGGGVVLSISLFSDQEEAETSDELALDFVRDELDAFDIERTEVIGGKVLVSRARAEVLEPTHA
jgi:Antibiotic biosynthesis monooxygenase